jgi:hypothetical protein
MSLLADNAHIIKMRHVSALFRSVMTAVLLCGLAGAAIAQTPAQRLAAWSQTVMRHRIENAAAAREAEKGRLESMIKQMERQTEILHDAAIDQPDGGWQPQP